MKIRSVFLCLAMALSGPVAYGATVGDSRAGQGLHAANCGGCHDAGVYTRKDRKVRSLDDLQTQLQGCSHAAKKDFSPAETQNLLKFLNDSYYHFK